jgi:hypothetical protein
MMPWKILAITVLLAYAAPGFTAAKPTGIAHVEVYGVGGPPRAGRRGDYPLAGVAVQVKSRAAAPPVAEVRTGSTGSVNIRLRPGDYSINGFLTPPAVTPRRRCEATPKRVRIQRGRSATVHIFCSIK